MKAIESCLFCCCLSIPFLKLIKFFKKDEKNLPKEKSNSQTSPTKPNDREIRVKTNSNKGSKNYSSTTRRKVSSNNERFVIGINEGDVLLPKPSKVPDWKHRLSKPSNYVRDYVSNDYFLMNREPLKYLTYPCTGLRIKQLAQPKRNVATINLKDNMKLKCQLDRIHIDHKKVENRRNLARMKQTEPYWKPNLNNTNLKSKANVIGILKNGFISPKNGVEILGKRFILNNTCAFDSIIQILSVSYADSKQYRHWVDEQKSSILLWKLVSSLVNYGTSGQSYKERVQILKERFEAKRNGKDNNTYLLSVECTVERMLKNLTDTCPSTIQFKKCPVCNVVESTYKNHAIRIMVSPNNILNMNALINKELFPTELFISQCKNNRCSGFVTIENSYPLPSPHIFVDLMVEINFDKPIETEVELLLSIKINEIPKKLTVHRDKFYLRGCIIFIVGKNPSINTIGHYVAICLRKNNEWEMYDDMKQKVVKFNPNKKVNVQMLVYSK